MEEPEGSSLSLQRTATAENHQCDSCGEQPKGTLLLDVLMDHNWVSLCPECELHLIALLLQNYTRRKRRDKPVGEIPKLPAEGELSDEAGD